MSKWIIMVLSLSLMALPTFAAEAEGGNHGGGGGNTVAAEFQQIARAVGATFKHEEMTPFGTSGDALMSLINRMEVEQVKGPLRLDSGEIVDAINFPKNEKPLVKVDLKKWPRKKTEKKVLLVVHELLGLLKKPDPQYKLSSIILQKIIKADTGNWTSSYEKLLTMSQPDMLKSAKCDIYDRGPDEPVTDADINMDRDAEFDPNVPITSFKLNDNCHGLCGYSQPNDDIKVEASISYAPLRQISIHAYIPCSKKHPCGFSEAIGHENIGQVTSNFIGEFKDIEVEFGRYKIRCDAQ